MALGLTPSEKFVHELSEKSFLKAWTHPNPIGKKRKELCDCLIVCAKHIIIISVKEIQYKDTGDSLGYERWIKNAIEDSVGQIWGAERWLQTQTVIERHDGRIITLPLISDRKYHRISVSLGSKCQIPIQWGDLGHGFVHVCDENSVEVLFKALDTITDFTDFLQSSENLMNKKIGMIFDGGGLQDLIALYIQRRYSLNFATDESHPDMLILDNDIWNSLSKSTEYKDMLIDFKTSYIWDKLIESYSADLLTGGMFEMHSKEVTNNELALVTMALQPRRYRANLADAFMEFLQKEELKIASRVVMGYDNVAFVFLIGKSSDREFRAKELLLRCSIVDVKRPEIKTIVGIATDRSGPSDVGYSSDIAYIHNSMWTEQEKEKILKLSNELGYFKNI
ncbi:MAG: hypothetical protein JU82_06260 [Sulfuricurvum sp. MLSB]|uniref:hypothetical protein n=1 Tax=unclassified Sulfuricurvum TaxID=2632390 RepID=UPI000500A6B2|nr:MULTISPECIES: hypothetical protein [unclassified Sulfuricurvum]KFN39685.1 MAG: hypothetical protein JU82_06260 [Sulfuricurvum sp. MLSB]